MSGMTQETLRELMLALEFLRWACEHAEGKDRHEALLLQAAMSVGCRVLAKHGHLLEDFQREPYWQQVRSLPWTFGIIPQGTPPSG